MKILKPGKVEQRKFVCCCCGCEFIAAASELEFDAEIDDEIMPCPQSGCGCRLVWEYGEPYEEPTPTQADRERLIRLLQEARTKHLTHLTKEVVDYLIENGVTFREG